MYAPLCIWLLLHLAGITSCFVSLPILSSSTDSVHVHSLLSSSIETQMNYDKMISHESLELLLLSLILHQYQVPKPVYVAGMIKTCTSHLEMAMC